MRSVRETQVFMDTTVTAEIVGDAPDDACHEAFGRAFAWFREVEARCSRFDPSSELRGLSTRPTEPVAVSEVLFAAVQFALEVARESGGAFDPTIGARMEARGFDRDYRTGRPGRSGVVADAGACWTDVLLDGERRTITLRRPLLLDLGAVAKGLAIDLALRELAGFTGAAIEAGGDVAVRGPNPEGTAWRIGIRHPRRPEGVCTVLCLRDAAVCTSGDYERRAPPPDGGSHLLDPRTGRPVDAMASCSVVAPSAMLADALSTAASVQRPVRAIAWLRRRGVEAVLFTPALMRYATPGFARLEQCQ